MPEKILASRIYSEERVNRWKERILKNKEIFLVAEDDGGRVVGFACGGKGRDDRIDMSQELYAFYVDVSVQRQGYGKALFERFVQEVGGNFYLFMLEGNENAASFYENRGCLLQPAFFKEERHEEAVIREVCYFYLSLNQ